MIPPTINRILPGPSMQAREQMICALLDAQRGPHRLAALREGQLVQVEVDREERALINRVAHRRAAAYFRISRSELLGELHHARRRGLDRELLDGWQAGLDHAP